MRHMKKFASLMALAAALPLVTATSVNAAQTFTTDVIVQASLCVGVDCASSESFGFDTFRLKENNLRIHFDDTSASASFPSNDWRIIANDSGNGGANYLAIEDSTAGRTPFRVEAGAPVNTLYVEADGDVGIKTSEPVVDLHIVEGNSPTLRLEQDGSDGFTPQTWDVAGNEANFFIRDVTNGSQLAFRIEPGADESAIHINNVNRIGFGTSSPRDRLNVRDTSGTAFGLRLSGSEEVWSVQNQGTGGNFRISNASDDNAVPTSQFEIDEATGNVGFGQSTPLDRLHVQDTTGTWYGMRFQTSTGAGDIWRIVTNPGNDRFSITKDGTNQSEFLIDGATGNITIRGTITTGGTTCGGGCDLVFTEDYDMPSIEEHAEAMWSNGFLPNVGPTIENEPINVTEKLGRMLNELETAHIFIAELNGELAESEARYNALATETAEQHAVLLARLEQLEASID